MPLRHLDGHEVLVIWPSSKLTWLSKLAAVEFSEEELAEIERIEKEFWDMQKKLEERFDYKRFYV